MYKSLAMGVVLKLHETITAQLFTMFLPFRVAVKTMTSGHDVSKRWSKQVQQTDDFLSIRNFVKEDDIPRNLLTSFHVKFMIYINET